MQVHIGIDDTDSAKGGCTTYIAALILEKLASIGYVEFLDFPNLVRLNPNCPFKTRGNASVCIRVNAPENKLDSLIDLVVDLVQRSSWLEDNRTSPGVVVHVGPIPSELKLFASYAEYLQIPLRTALKLIRKFNCLAYGIKRGTGLIGALAAVGNTLEGDHTYELIAYRKGTKTSRKVDASSVILMDRVTRPYTFNNIDPETGRILITPHGPDPVLYGIRGEHPDVLLKAKDLVKVHEPIRFFVLYRTNQATDNHLKFTFKIRELRPYQSALIRGYVLDNPAVIRGGHVLFKLTDNTGVITCVVYKPTGALCELSRKLMPGDYIEVGGGIKHDFALNVEKIRVIKLAKKYVYENPRCPNCLKRTKSAGRNKGFRCEKCKTKLPKATKVRVEVRRNIEEGIYLPPPRSQRHLIKPLQRYGMEKSGFKKRLLTIAEFFISSD